MGQSAAKIRTAELRVKDALEQLRSESGRVADFEEATAWLYKWFGTPDDENSNAPLPLSEFFNRAKKERERLEFLEDILVEMRGLIGAANIPNAKFEEK